MAYARPYSRQEVTEIMAASEGRPRPDIVGGKPGHTFALHSQERVDVFRRPDVADPRDLPIADSIFLVDRNALAEIVHEALNSVPGQRELAKLDADATKSVEIRSVILRQGNDCNIFVVYRPQIPGDQMSFDWLSAVPGDGCIVDLYVKVYKIPGSQGDRIHIQTVHAKDFARTQGDSIVRAEPLPGSKNYPGGSRRAKGR